LPAAPAAEATCWGAGQIRNRNDKPNRVSFRGGAVVS
jgi:hypothetical protein